MEQQGYGGGGQSPYSVPYPQQGGGQPGGPGGQPGATAFDPMAAHSTAAVGGQYQQQQQQGGQYYQQQGRSNPFDNAPHPPQPVSYSNQTSSISVDDNGEFHDFSSHPVTPTTTNNNNSGAKPIPSRTSSSNNNNNHGGGGGATGILVADRLGDEETEDGRIRNKEASIKIRDAWIYKQIRARQVRILYIFFVGCSYIFMDIGTMM